MSMRMYRFRFDPKRVVRVPLAGECLAHMLSPQPRQRRTDLPADVSYVGSYYDAMTDSFGLYLESETFEPVPEGRIIPERAVRVTED